MKFELNGVAQEAPAPLSVQELLARFGLLGRRVAVAVNSRVVPRSRHGEVVVGEGDSVEVIQAVGGG